MLCKKCGKAGIRVVVGTGMCEECYKSAVQKKRIRKCVYCGEEKEIHARGLCSACYSRYKKRGTPEYERIKKVCSVDGCDNIACAHGLCNTHYMRWKRHGHLEQTRPAGWGAKEKHPLHAVWAWRKRSYKYNMSQEWLDDFWKFVEDVGERPSKRHILTAIDDTKELSKNNFTWELPLIHHKKDADGNVDRNKYAKEYRAKRARRIKDSSLRKTYGITLDEYDELYEKQNGVCAICGGKETMKQNGCSYPQDLAVDHCHTTGRIRGLLCTKCNTGLGSFKDSPELLQKAINYLTMEVPDATSA